MWKPETVERALFRWRRWRQTIVNQWVNSDLESLSDLKSRAEDQLLLLNFPESLWLELYWISVVAADFCFNDESSFDRIVVPAGLCVDQRLASYDLPPGTRVYPPRIWSEKDIDFASRQLGWPKTMLYSKPLDMYVYLPSDHELYSVLSKLKGRPKKNLGKRGRRPLFSDRLAVRCASKRPDRTFVEIAKMFGLPTQRYIFSEQSDTVRHLVARGRKLLEETGCDSLP